MSESNYQCVLSIAGTDPSGGAGIQADIKAISATGSYAASVITALVAQNTTGVQEILDVPASFVKKQLDCVCEDLQFNAVKIGMLHRKEIIQTVAQAIHAYHLPQVVLDPVMVAKNGCALIEDETVNDLITILFPWVSLITPNIPEAERLLNRKISTRQQMEKYAELLGLEYNINVLIKGGHLSDSTQCSDVLFNLITKDIIWFQGERVQTNNTHGTGCSLFSCNCLISRSG
jgi:hydroxymethylpyrimidine/phosphomethylpyrimidine kinase